MAELWEKLPHETHKAYQAFSVYRDLGLERSLDRTLDIGQQQKKITTRTKSQLAEWSRKYQWVSRARAYDEHLERLERQKREKAILDMRERHAKLARAVQAKAVERLNGLSPGELTAADVLKYVIEAAKLERLSMGEPESTVGAQVTGEVAHHHKLDLSRLTDEELDQLERIVGKASDVGGSEGGESPPASE